MELKYSLPRFDQMLVERKIAGKTLGSIGFETLQLGSYIWRSKLNPTALKSMPTSRFSA